MKKIFILLLCIIILITFILLIINCLNRDKFTENKIISLEEAYISPYFEKYCYPDRLLEYTILTGKNKDNYNYLLDPDNRRFKQADEQNITYIISATVPGSQYLNDINDAPIFCKLTNDYFKNKVDSYNLKNNTSHSFFGVLPFNNVDSAINELKRLNSFNPPINRILFNGPTVNNNYYDWLDGKQWEKLWKYANENKTVFYVHPFVARSLSNKLPDQDMENYISKYPQIIGSQYGFHINDGIFFLKLYINKVFDNYPNIQWIAGHMGETLIWFLWRFDHRTKIYKNEIKDLKKLEKNHNSLLTRLKSFNTLGPSVPIDIMDFPKKTLTEIFTTQPGKKHAQIVCTTSGWFNSKALKFAHDTVGVENVLFSIDTPYENFDTTMKWFNNLCLSKKNKSKLAWKNANDILFIFPKK